MLRSQAEQRSIELLTERKNWETTISERENEIVELKTKIMQLEEKEKDIMIELKVWLLKNSLMNRLLWREVL